MWVIRDENECDSHDHWTIRAFVVVCILVASTYRPSAGSRTILSQIIPASANFVSRTAQSQLPSSEKRIPPMYWFTAPVKDCRSHPYPYEMPVPKAKPGSATAPNSCWALTGLKQTEEDMATRAVRIVVAWWNFIVKQWVVQMLLVSLLYRFCQICETLSQFSVFSFQQWALTKSERACIGRRVGEGRVSGREKNPVNRFVNLLSFSTLQ